MRNFAPFYEHKSQYSMNLYIRYFDDECVVSTVEEALDFISNFPDFRITPQFIEDFRQYAEGPMPYPKRYKVRTRVYFIVIKTNASSLSEFKANGKGVAENEEVVDGESPMMPEMSMRQRQKELVRSHLQAERPGWYEASICFKRVVYVPERDRYDYIDTTFAAQLKAHSAQDCYDRIMDHLRSRADIDPRSQYPSVRGKNFHYTYLGLKPYEEIAV